MSQLHRLGWMAKWDSHAKVQVYISAKSLCICGFKITGDFDVYFGKPVLWHTNLILLTISSMRKDWKTVPSQNKLICPWILCPCGALFILETLLMLIFIRVNLLSWHVISQYLPRSPFPQIMEDDSLSKYIVCAAPAGGYLHVPQWQSRWQQC